MPILRIFDLGCQTSSRVLFGLSKSWVVLAIFQHYAWKGLTRKYKPVEVWKIR